MKYISIKNENQWMKSWDFWIICYESPYMMEIWVLYHICYSVEGLWLVAYIVELNIVVTTLQRALSIESIQLVSLIPARNNKQVANVNVWVPAYLLLVLGWEWCIEHSHCVVVWLLGLIYDFFLRPHANIPIFTPRVSGRCNSFDICLLYTIPHIIKDDL